MKLGTLLLRDGVISLNQLEAALRAQVLYGGRLGTNLVELDFIGLEDLGEYLSKVTGLPVATHGMFEAIDPELTLSFGPELADLYSAVPLRYEPDDPGKLAVAFVDGTDSDSIAQLANLCDCGIAPYTAPELRILYYLEQCFGLARQQRFIRTGTRQHTPESSDDRRRSQPAGGIQLPPAVRFEPKKKTGDKATAADTSGPPAADSIPRPERSISYREAGGAIDNAVHRNEIGDALAEFAVGRFEVGVVFLLRDQNAMGWRLQSTRGGVRGGIEQLGLALGGTSVLQAAHDSGDVYRGTSPSPAKPVEQKLWKALGTGEPADMMVVPVLVKRRVVNLVYVHGFDGEPLPDHLCDELVELARKASDAYMRLIQQAKAAVHAEQDSQPSQC